MFETNSGNLIQKSEALALQEIERLSKLYGEVLTKKEIIERIKEINKSIALYDLLIESSTFSKLIEVTQQKFPRIKDRMYSALEYLYKKLEEEVQEDQLDEYVEYATTLIFSWDKAITKEILINIEDLRKFTECKDEESLKACTKEMIKKYGFRADLYNYTNKEQSTNITLQQQYIKTIAYIEKIGPLISIYEAFKSNQNREIKKLGILISVIQLAISHLNLNSFTIPHVLPSLLRSIMHHKGYKETHILNMKINEIINLTKEDEIGKKVIELSKAITEKNKVLISSSPSGERFYAELEINKFWDSIEFLPELSLLEYVSRASSQENSSSISTELKKLYPHAGELNDILYGE